MKRLDGMHTMRVSDVRTRAGKSRSFSTVIIDQVDGDGCGPIPCDIGSDAPPSVGDVIEAAFVVGGREWQGKVFAVIGLADWRVIDTPAAQPPEPPQDRPQGPRAPDGGPVAQAALVDTDDGALPF